MKKNKILGIVLIVAAVLSTASAFLIKSGAPEIRNTLENAAYVSDGKVAPENEGKVVIVPGTLEADLPFVDQETGIVINSIVSWRHVEKLRVGEDSEEKTQYWVWDFEHSSASFGGDKKLIAPNVTLGEFAVAEEFAQTLSANRKRTEFTEKELNQMGWNVFTDEGRTYLYQGEIMPEDETDIDKYNTNWDDNAYKDYIGTLRVSYEEREGKLDYTIVGLQQNGQLVKAPELGLQFVCTGHLSADELLELADSNAKSSSITAYVFAVVLLVAGVVVLVKKEKKV